MGISSQYAEDKKSLNIAIKGKFDFNMVNDFRKAYSGSDNVVKECTVDFRDSDYLDSSGLGMLLNLKRFYKDDIKINLANCKPQVKKILIISRFDKKFSIH